MGLTPPAKEIAEGDFKASAFQALALIFCFAKNTSPAGKSVNSDVK
ncbi:MAG: hypothetical protein PHR96_00975 [Clostridia bacterium]|nr:hypothetical protein [Clostridia bacterium]